ncbi:uncharacterized protein LY79DRAFT_544216 [Colletotrichum navitas]|uniref:Uncharacterized protein n=1 Tax=Colletotrichum navitas TaxID=681940 RepID=A0AAD8Q5I0_9PEZI|nr:uncharacterized protein LY79DRAFT_544216 [Colletotrichum navitas]KAK1596266.1 hypothetical protein LY79DRAFT_544216 [Colletotrichum navitas]
MLRPDETLFGSQRQRRGNCLPNEQEQLASWQVLMRNANSNSETSRTMQSPCNGTQRHTKECQQAECDYESSWSVDQKEQARLMMSSFVLAIGNRGLWFIANVFCEPGPRVLDMSELPSSAVGGLGSRPIRAGWSRSALTLGVTDAARRNADVIRCRLRGDNVICV